MGADANVVEHREIGKQRDVLEGAADADLGDPVRRARQDADVPSIRISPELG